jgi:hypothetical protein
MPLSPVALCSRALLKIGAHPIQSFYDDRTEAEIALAFFEPVRDALLSSYPWRFARAHLALPRLEAAPLSGFSYAYQLPADCLRILSIEGNAVYRRVGNEIHSDASEIMLSYIFRPDDETAPAYFESALMAKLAAEFCLPLTEDSARANFLYKLSETEAERARRIDAQQDSPSGFDDFNLVTVRG